MYHSRAQLACAAALFIAWLTIRPTKESESAAEARPGADPSDPEAWFTRLEGVLIGRHDLPPARAADLVGEARAHFTGTSPAEESAGSTSAPRNWLSRGRDAAAPTPNSTTW